MSYLKKIEIVNFMRIGHALLEFDDTNIINLVGYNDSGKSAITRAVEVVLYDSYSNDQVNFIKDGEDYFKVTLSFDDGVVISKEKHITGKSVWEMYVNGELVFTNNVNGNIVAVYQVPEVIAKYLKVVEDENTNEKLNVRRRSDKLFLIETSGGDNYKILNTVLQVDVLSDAFKRMNEDKNKLMSELTSLGVQRDTIKNECDNIHLIDDKDEEDLEALLLKVKHLQSKYDDLKLVYDYYKLKESIYVFDELKDIDINKFKLLNSMLQLKQDKEVEVWDELYEVSLQRMYDVYKLAGLQKDSEIQIWDNLKVVDTDRLLMLNDIIRLQKVKDLYVYDPLQDLNVDYYSQLSSVMRVYKDYKIVVSDYEKIDKELEKERNKLKEVAEELNARICENCGTVVL